MTAVNSQPGLQLRSGLVVPGWTQRVAQKLLGPWVNVMTVITARSKTEVCRGARAAGLSARQQDTVRQLEREEICVGRIVEVLEDCGWIQISDVNRQLRATVDRDGTVLALEGPGRRRKRLRAE